MSAVRVIMAAVGRMKDGPERNLLDRYWDRLATAGRPLGWSAASIAEILESRASSPQARQRDEAERLLAKTAARDLTIVLDEKGRRLDSPAFASYLRSRQESGARDLCLLIGGPDGHGSAAVEAADLVLSLGPMTFPHMLARILVAEQLYRAATILSGHPYHRA
jgi:23S rRNA (pseudouridine1915-N3)-methyltransferase